MERKSNKLLQISAIRFWTSKISIFTAENYVRQRWTDDFECRSLKDRKFEKQQDIVEQSPCTIISDSPGKWEDPSILWKATPLLKCECITCTQLSVETITCRENEMIHLKNVHLGAHAGFAAERCALFSIGGLLRLSPVYTRTRLGRLWHHRREYTKYSSLILTVDPDPF